ncbi:12241_t:CDS:2 [Ambispora gerdemannii]|uniref:12241_t:CDS:1 n=1 Tax=Ambispora gerdemannii TaxID=144530 RepID=A0A9N8VXC1_9GLOM|nr:12241_t:CDS:2 [Ambispora gerdemannii]
MEVQRRKQQSSSLDDQKINDVDTKIKYIVSPFRTVTKLKRSNYTLIKSHKKLPFSNAPSGALTVSFKSNVYWTKKAINITLPRDATFKSFDCKVSMILGYPMPKDLVILYHHEELSDKEKKDLYDNSEVVHFLCGKEMTMELLKNQTLRLLHYWRYAKLSGSVGDSTINNDESEIEFVLDEQVPLERRGMDNANMGNEDNIDYETFQRVGDRIPTAAWYIVLCELCERFTYYGVSGPFQNYIQFPKPKHPGDQSGALGKGQRVATALALFFSFFCYLTPILGAIIADRYIGKYKTILFSSFVYMVGLSVLTFSALPASVDAGAALPGLVLALIIIGFGAGGIKSNVSSMVAEQYHQKKAYLKTLETGEKVVVDPKLTVQSIFHWFYLAINIGALSSIITTNVEKYHSFWLAYLIPLIVFVIAISIFFHGRYQYIQTPPKGSIVIDAARAFRIALANGRNLDKARPSQMTSLERQRRKIKYNDEFIDELRSTVNACQVFIFYPVYWAAYNQLHTNLISQGATMQTGVIPNDIMSNIDPITLIILIPILDRWFYPALRKRKILFGPITRMFIGFMFSTLAMTYSAVVQLGIYNTGPCYERTHCTVDGKTVPNNISIWWQTPTYILTATSEAFACVSALEFAFQKAPASMKSIVVALYLGTTGLGAALGFTIIPLSKDPYTIYVYAILAFMTFISGCAMLFFFRQYNRNDWEESNNSIILVSREVTDVNVHGDVNEEEVELPVAEQEGR